MKIHFWQQLFRQYNMKTLMYSLFVLFLLTTCDKKVEYTSVIVVRDCSGTYLNLNGKDYFVCNPDKITSVLDNSELLVTYAPCDECTDRQTHCTIARPFEGCFTILNYK